MIGHVFAQRYQLEEFVGKGGMALVFRAKDKRTGHDVAVKILRPEFNSDNEFLERFQREAVAASKMSSATASVLSVASAASVAASVASVTASVASVTASVASVVAVASVASTVVVGSVANAGTARHSIRHIARTMARTDFKLLIFVSSSMVNPYFSGIQSRIFSPFRTGSIISPIIVA